MWRKDKDTVTSCAVFVAIGLFSGLIYDITLFFLNKGMSLVNSLRDKAMKDLQKSMFKPD
jgi:hypothetical protein